MTTTNNFDDPGWDALGVLFSAYLHQDWKEMHGDAWGAVNKFRSLESPEDVKRAADQVHALLEHDYDEGQLDEITGQLGSYYYPPGGGWTYRGWLTELERFLRAES